MNPPVLFTFGLHLHQPVGNFDSVFEQHLADVYRPLLEALDAGGAWPVSLHLSGPLLDWLEANATSYLDLLGRRVADGQIELLLAGYDEPILAVLPRADRLEQIGRLREAIVSRFGVTATGLWLTERVWEPDLVTDLAQAGVGYVLVDDRHFLVAGFAREQLHRPFLTEAGGSTIGVFPIDERLRYLVPFRPPSELAEYFRALRAAGAPLAVLADDGEKFGGWPGTLEWVYGSGWIKEFTATLRQLTDQGEIRLATFAEAFASIQSGGLSYLPSASYREMEGWALPPSQALRLGALEREIGKERVAGPDGALLRGTHWRHFFVKYSESNRMHKKMLALSALCRERGDPADARRAIGRAQCNDAYWHGVFGGLYLPHLRDGIWRELARAEGLLRQGQRLRSESTDLDCDGQKEIWIHSDRCSALIAPHRGGAVEEWTHFGPLTNLANVLTRRHEAYHEAAVERGAAAHATDGDGAASIHDLEAHLTLDAMPPFDTHDRAIWQERLVGPVASAADWAAGRVAVIRSWATETGPARVEATEERVEVDLTLGGLHKRITLDRDGRLRAAFRWQGAAGGGEWFTTELSLAGEVHLETDATQQWRYPIETVAKSERGFDRTIQGTAIVLGWPVAAGQGWAAIRPS
jgi:alpha-amylase